MSAEPPIDDKKPLAPIKRREIKFVDGEPVLVTQPQLTKTQVQDVVAVAVSTLYDGEEPEFQGMTNLEVAAVKVARRMAETGDAELLENALDRLIGKAKTVSEVHKTVVTYEQKIKQIAERRKSGAGAAPKVIDVEPLPATVDPLEGLI